MIDRLPELKRFNEARGIEPGESLDLLLATTTKPIVLFAPLESIEAASWYKAIIGKRDNYRPIEFVISEVRNPIEAVASLDRDDSEVIPLVIYSATNPILFERMFADGPSFGQLLMGHVYMPIANHQSPSIHVIGISNKGLRILSESKPQPNESLIQEMARIRRNALAGDLLYLRQEGRLSNDEFRNILRSQSVRKIIAHALGPVGTNISQAMELYIKTVGVEGKTDLIVHPAGIEPMAYAEDAMKEVEEGVVPLHMECAVYYEMQRLFNQRRNEVVFADHQYMALDTMQLASVKPIEELAARGVMRVATHPSPKPLIDPWIESKPPRAQWLKATSNAAAAQMVLSGEADACITTASSLNQEQAQTQGLVSRHVFGSPIMFFTIATPLTQEQLRNYH